MTIGGLSLLVRIASATESSEVRQDARRVLRDTAILWAIITLSPFVAVGVFTLILRST